MSLYVSECMCPNVSLFFLSLPLFPHSTVIATAVFQMPGADSRVHSSHHDLTSDRALCARLHLFLLHFFFETQPFCRFQARPNHRAAPHEAHLLLPDVYCSNKTCGCLSMPTSCHGDPGPQVCKRGAAELQL